jgi:hypothetical protein
MVRRASPPRSLVLALMLVAAIARAATFTESFDDGTLDPNLVLAIAPGFSATVTGGVLAVAKSEGTGNGDVHASTSFDAIGDFSATVRATRTALGGAAEMGLAVDLGTGAVIDIFFVGATQITARMPGVGPITIGEGSTTVVFRARRSGSQLYLECDPGSGFTMLLTGSDPSFAGAARFEAFLIQEFGSTAAHSGSFDDVAVTADQLAYPTTTTATTTTSTIGASDTTTSTLAPQVCALDAATFPSLVCRLVTLIETVRSSTGIPHQQAQLVDQLVKAKERMDMAHTLCAKPDARHARDRLRAAIRKMIQFDQRLRSKSGRRFILPALRDQLSAAGDGIRDGLKSLKGGLGCPVDAQVPVLR